MSTRGAVAAGHPLTAEAGAAVLREGGNAVDAAVAAVLTSFVTESPLTGFGAGGFMLVHAPPQDVLLDFFVEVPGRTSRERRSELVPIPVYFSPESPQVFNVGAASCGVPGTAAGLAEALGRYGSFPLAELAREPARLAREGVRVNAEQAFIFRILEPILVPRARVPGRLRARRPDPRRGRDVSGSRSWASALERYGTEGPEPFYSGEVAERVSEWVLERGGTLGPDDLAAYRAGAPRARAGRLSGAGRPHQPAAFLRGAPDRLRALAAGPGRDGGRRRRRRGDGGGSGCANRGVLPRAVRGRVRATVPLGVSGRDGRRAGPRAAGGRPIRRRSRRATGSARPRTSPPSTRRGAARRSPARTGPDRA